jgi:eukaryotic-like serine/threonine-protein kinase
MTPERWQQVTDTLSHALELSSAGRAQYLSEIAKTDPELRSEVESLLGSHEKAGAGFLNMPAVQSLPDLTVEKKSDRDTMLGRRLGAYQIVEQIGEGGMGAVYRAFRADDQYRKQVALKVIRGGEDSGFVVSRFRNERQILASLDHPNIARLLDGGTTDEGSPYFVMELIEGESLIRYCNHRQLSVSERLKLFLQVCSAVQFAHQHLIIHRDIKPGNILVTADGTPKLLDFGIAKILDSEAAPGQFEPTMTVVRLLTPGYASPEQIKGEVITTTTDVYSLGVVLYELLTGAHPHRVPGDTPQKIAKAVCEIEPRKPSTIARKTGSQPKPENDRASTKKSLVAENPAKLCKELSGDIDNIILMALRKEPQRRYVSVEQFAEDIRRHLADLPVVARKDTVGYRTSKFITRHKASVAAATIVAITLVAGLAITLYEAHVARVQAAIAREQKARAERRFNDVRKLANSLMFEIHDSIVDLPGATQARKLIVSRAQEYLDSLSQESNEDPSLQRELATAYDRVGDALGYSGAANLGDFAGASQNYAKALAIRESLGAANPADLTIQTELADEYFRVAGVLQSMGDFDGALKTLQRAQPFMQRVQAQPHDPKLEDRIAGLYFYTASVLEKKGDVSNALKNYRLGAAVREPIATDSPSSALFRAHLVADYNGIAKMLSLSGDIDDAIPYATKGLAIIQQLSDAKPDSATLREWLGESYVISGELFQHKGNLENALNLDRKAEEIFMKLRSADANNRLAAHNLAFDKLAIGEILVKQEKISQGQQNEREALAIFQSAGSKTLWDTTGVTNAYLDLGDSCAALAGQTTNSDAKTKNWRQARNWYVKADEVWKNRPNNAGADALGHDQAPRIAQGIKKCDASLQELASR